MHLTERHYLIVDLEATCDDSASPTCAVPRDEMETIEFGAVLLDGGTLEIVDEFEAFVRPVRHRVLTPFCTRLTTITQAQVDDADPLPVVMQRVADWLDGHADWRFCSWGAYDRKQLAQDFAHHGIASHPLLVDEADHTNLKAAFKKAHKLRRPCGVGRALQHLQMHFEGTPHRALDDTRNIARLVAATLRGDDTPAPA